MQAFSSFAAITAVALALSSSALATAPAGLSHHGRLLDATNAPVDGQLPVTFTLYDAPSNGNAVWSEEWEVTFTNGFYAVVLGDPEEGGSLDPLLFDRALFLGIRIGATGPELQPRQRLVSSPYAMRAVVADSMVGGTLTDVNITASSLSTTSLHIGNQPLFDENGAWAAPPGLVPFVSEDDAVLRVGDQEIDGAVTATRFVATETMDPPFEVFSSALVPLLNAERVGGRTADELVDRQGLEQTSFQNLVLNGSFERAVESGDAPFGWSLSGGATAAVVDDGLYGNRSLRLESADGSGGAGGSVGHDVLTASSAGFLVGRSYTATLWARRVAGTGDASLCLFDGPAAAQRSCVSLPSGATWGRVAVGHVLGSSPLGLFVAVETSNGSSTWELDGAMVNEGPLAPGWIPHPVDQLGEVGLGENALADGSVTTAKLADGAVTSVKLSAGAVDSGALAASAVTESALADGAVTSSKLADEAVTSNALAAGAIAAGHLTVGAVETSAIADDAVTAEKIAEAAVGPAALALGAVTANALAENAVETAAIANEAVTAEKLAPNAIGGASLADGSVTRQKIALEAVDGARIETATITGAHLASQTIGSAALASGAVTSSKLFDGAVSTEKLGAEAVTAEKLANGAVREAHLASDAVTTLKILNQNVTREKIADNAISSAKLESNAVVAAKIAPNAVQTAKLDDRAVTEAKLADDAVTTAKLLDDAVTDAKLANGAVVAGKLAPNAVGPAAIADGAVTEAKLGAGAVTTAKLAPGSVTEDRLQNGAVSTDKLATNAVASEKIRDFAVLSSKLGADSVLTDKIANNAVTTGKIADLAVSTDKLAGSAVTAVKLHDGAVITTKLADEAVTGAKIANKSITGGKLVDGTVGTLQLASGAVTNDTILANTIEGDRLRNNTVTASKIDRTGLDADLLDGLNSTDFLRSNTHATFTGNLDVTGKLTATDTVSATRLDGVYAPRRQDWQSAGVGWQDAAIYNDGNDYKALMILGNRAESGDRLVWIWDRLTVQGPIEAKGAITGPSLSVSGAVSGASVTASGAVGGTTVTANGAVTGASLDLQGTSNQGSNFVRIGNVMWAWGWVATGSGNTTHTITLPHAYASGSDAYSITLTDFEVDGTGYRRGFAVRSQSAGWFQVWSPHGAGTTNRFWWSTVGRWR